MIPTPPEAAAKMARAELKPCAHCGMEVAVLDGDSFSFWFHCNMCNADGPRAYDKTEASAIAAWNTRARDAALVAEVEALRARYATDGVCEIAAANPNVASYVEHWEGRATKAEAENATLLAQRDAADRAGEARAIEEIMRECMGPLVGASDGGTHIVRVPDLMRMQKRLTELLALLAPAAIEEGAKSDG